ncbi:MAG: metal-dependent phosphohydrolase [Candidatus Cloacimonetes bacterium HGW-Cloacimonetes-3]|jgi:HD-GYP domain-containing protein (c-di-GMP phosphodiesterase class II)|nr:MAG: metal-dependent phosphohydrolase [Candidatus Cloacimonetes bacterium HGW-Cloacimonetes-3]
MKYDFSPNQNVNKMLNNVVQNITHLAEEQLLHIKRLTRIGESLSSETDLDKIFDMILEEGIEFTLADAATIYKVSEDGLFLEFEIVYNATLNLRQGGSRNPITWAKSIPLYTPEGEPSLSYIVTSVYHKKSSLSFDDVYETKDYNICGTIDFDTKSNYRCKSMLTIPLKNHEDEVLGVIQFINAMDADKNIVSFTDEHKTMLSSLASQAAIALSNRKLIQSLETLLNQFVRSIATAIERKSKYSGAHISRVATLTELFADKINQADEHYFGGRRFNENELKELSMAGWMHDVGKIVTPEYVMDKSTKLETIFDRIEMVQLRFEKLELLLKLLQTQMNDVEFAAYIKEHIDAEIEPGSVFSFIAEAIVFVTKLNFGEEFVAEEDLNRIEKLCNIDFEHDGLRFFLFTDNEKKNLMIKGRGTFTGEEYQVMKDHVSITLEMLSQLTFPKKFKNVAFYASTHHEALNGKGYPRGLNAEQLPLQSRIIAVADIFEALTAADRPYKKPKSLSESLDIMATMVKIGHLDKDLVDYFMDSGLYLEYAHRFMQPEFIDEVNIEALKSKYAAV